MFIRPASDPDQPGDRMKVRDPHTMRHLAADGEDKPDDDYWQRRLREGGVERCDPPAPAEPEESVQ